MAETNRTVLLTKVPTEAEAVLLRDALAAKGINAVYNGDTIADFRAEVPAMIRLLVAEADLPRAKEILAEAKNGLEIDWSRVDVGEPE